MSKTFKEFLAPAGYSEGVMALVLHLGILYKLDRIFELSVDLPVTNMNVDDLKWQFEQKEVDEARRPKIDTKVPIIVTPHNGKYIILDGIKRAKKAMKAGDKTIPTRIVFHDILAMAKLGSGPDVTWASNVGDLNAYLGESYKVGEGHKALSDALKKVKQGPGKPTKDRVKRAFAELTGISGNRPSFELEQLFPDRGRDGCVDEFNDALDALDSRF